MSIKRILVPLPGSAAQTSEIDLALSAAKLLGAHVEALAITDAVPIGPEIGFPPGPYAARVATAAAVPVARLMEERARHLHEQHARFAEACSLHQIPIVTDAAAITSLPAATWHEVEGEYARVAVQRAAAFDLMVATSAAVVERLKDIAERSLLRTQRPVLLAPARHHSNLTGTAIIAWDESLQCWHAVSAALPFLRAARSVMLVSVDRDAAARQASHAEVLAYLACHGVAAEPHVMAPDGRSIGETLLAAAATTEAGLLVMGAYVHSRIREMLLGSATRHVLQNASATPVLMAH
jgi:nucleotide-binding universal stress UspA family protein